MRLKVWQIFLYGIASVLYVMEYLFILLTMDTQDYDYRVKDYIYFQWQCTIYLLLFISIFHSFRHHSKSNRTIVFAALSVSVIRFITQGLEGLRIINAGDIEVIVFNFILLILSILTYAFKSKFILWYKNLR